MAGYNPMAALNAINPSLIGYMGGYGKAFGALGNSMEKMGQAKLDLAQQDKDNASKAAYLDLQKSYYSDAQTAKKEAKQEKFDSNIAANSYLYGAMGKDVPGELTNERAQLGMLDPSIVAKAMPEPTKIIGDFKGDDGKVWNKYSDGSAKPVNADVGFYDSSMFDKNLQYIKSADGKTKVPTLVLTNMFSGQNRETPLPGETAAEYNERLSKDLSLQNTLTAQKNKATLDVQTQPQIADIKETQDVTKTVEALFRAGFKEISLPNLNKVMKVNPNVDWREQTIRGVKTYYAK